MRVSVSRVGRAVFLSAVLSGSALAQNLGSVPNTAQIQNLEHTAMKVGIIGAAAGIGVTVISLAVRHHHHSARTSKANDDKDLAAAYAAGYTRASQEAQARSPKASVLGVAPIPAKSAGEIKETNPSDNPSLPAQAVYGSQLAAAARPQQ